MKKVELSSDRSNNGKQASVGSGSTSPGWSRKEKVVLSIKARHRLMSKSTSTKGRLIGAMLYFFLFMYTFIIFFGEALLLPKDEMKWCVAAKYGYPGMNTVYENPDYNTNPCFRERTAWLLFANMDECDMARRMICSVLFGAIIGFERKTSERPAGIRTMSLVCLGACFFTVSSMRAFRSSTMGWDAARVSAAIPSGVGFLGTALIWKGTTGKKGTPEERNEVHGLTTAASIWLSAAIGVGTGGRLILLSAYAVALVIIVLRVGPRFYFSKESESYLSDDEDEGWGSSENEMFDEDEEDDVDKMSMEEKTKLLSGKTVTQQAYMPVPIKENQIMYEEALKDLEFPRKKLVRLKPRNSRIRSLSPRALMKARRPTFHG